MTTQLSENHSENLETRQVDDNSESELQHIHCEYILIKFTLPMSKRERMSQSPSASSYDR